MTVRVTCTEQDMEVLVQVVGDVMEVGAVEVSLEEKEDVMGQKMEEEVCHT